MLVANPGQTPYSLISKKHCPNKPARNNALVGSSSIKYAPSSSATISPSSSAMISKTMPAVTEVPSSKEQSTLKTLSVRISRETDLLKHTVQRALLSKIPSHFSSVLSLYTVPPTSIHQFPGRTETLSVDSLRTEMCHFKPIRTVPTTPTKRSKDVTIKIPKAKIALVGEQSCDGSKGPKPSSVLSTAAVLASTRVSAFSSVALIDKISANTDLNKQHKTKSKLTHSCAKINEQNLNLKKNCTQPRVLLKHMTDCNEKKDFIPPTPVKHHTRRYTRKSTTPIMEMQGSGTAEDVEMRVTRKRQKIVQIEESVSNKNVKVSKDCIKSTKSYKKPATDTEKRRSSRRTPPVTRSRLKQTMIITRRQYQKM